MTVTELKEELQKLEDEGHGDCCVAVPDDQYGGTYYVESAYYFNGKVLLRD